MRLLFGVGTDYATDFLTPGELGMRQESRRVEWFLLIFPDPGFLQLLAQSG